MPTLTLRWAFWLLVGSARVSEVSGTGMVHCSDDTIRGTTDGPQVHAILHVVLLQLGQDVLSIGVLSQSRDVWPDLERTVCVTLAREACDITNTFPDIDCIWCTYFIPQRYLCPLIASKPGALALSIDTTQGSHPGQGSTCQPAAQHLPTGTQITGCPGSWDFLWGTIHLNSAPDPCLSRTNCAG